MEMRDREIRRGMRKHFPYTFESLSTTPRPSADKDKVLYSTKRTRPLQCSTACLLKSYVHWHIVVLSPAKIHPSLLCFFLHASS